MKGDNCSRRGCGKKAIGYYAARNFGLNVCEDHAPKEILNMKSGEKTDYKKMPYFCRY